MGRCELLSNLYLCIGYCNMPKYDKDLVTVVNCFQICIFASDIATASARKAGGLRCELLSNLYLCIGYCNLRMCSMSRAGVVNCFQICIFASDIATVNVDIVIAAGL